MTDQRHFLGVTLNFSHSQSLADAAYTVTCWPLDDAVIVNGGMTIGDAAAALM